MEENKKATEAAQRIHINCINALTGYTCKDSDNEYIIQKNKVFNSLNESPKTMLMVAKETGIERASVCWFVRDFRKNNKVRVHKIGYCPITKHKAAFLTTDKALFKDDSEQLSLFDIWEKGGME
jgi:hypothetical protein